ncbi:hypothetical protein [Chania multitudinisentens]|uniref:hypothetical protein n=1 Tax=Chania multitudinisentens TaxID=1639108 RepID=UPI0003E12F80|nr:hypothetical protein [Chania multitudinisentens]
MDNKSRTSNRDVQLQHEATLPPAWQLNELQRAFIEDLWQSEVGGGELPGATEHLATSD